MEADLTENLFTTYKIKGILEVDLQDALLFHGSVDIGYKSVEGSRNPP